MQLRVPALAASFLVLAACGGKVDGAAASDHEQTSDGGNAQDGGGSISPTPTPTPTVGSSVATNAASITVSTEVLGEKMDPDGECSASMETITLDVESGALTVTDCETGEMTIRSQKTLDSNQLADIKKLLQSYVATSPPPKSECGYDGTAFSLDVTTSSGTKTTYWDEAYNCEYPDDIGWVTPILRPLFNALDSL